MSDPAVRAKQEASTLAGWGVKNIFQRMDVRRAGMLRNHNVDHPLKCPKIRAKQEKTMTDRHGARIFSQCPQIMALIDWSARNEKTFDTWKKNGHGVYRSASELLMESLLVSSFGAGDILSSVPTNGWLIDFYIISHDIYVQFDGDYWHGATLADLDPSKPSTQKIVKNIERDKKQDAWFFERKFTLIRVLESEFNEALESKTVGSLIERIVTSAC